MGEAKASARAVLTVLRVRGLAVPDGEGIRRSQPFSLAGQTVGIRVKTGSSGQRAGGFVAIGLGGMSILGGLFVMMLSSWDQWVRSEQPRSGPNAGVVIGGVVMGVGVVGIVSGIIAITGNRTEVTIVPLGPDGIAFTF